MKIYQINMSTGEVFWVSNQAEAAETGNALVEKKSSATGQSVTYDVTPIEVPLLKPQFLDWLNAMFGGLHDA